MADAATVTALLTVRDEATPRIQQFGATLKGTTATLNEQTAATTVAAKTSTGFGGVLDTVKTKLGGVTDGLHKAHMEYRNIAMGIGFAVTAVTAWLSVYHEIDDWLKKREEEKQKGLKGLADEAEHWRMLTAALADTGTEYKDLIDKASDLRDQGLNFDTELKRLTDETLTNYAKKVRSAGDVTVRWKDMISDLQAAVRDLAGQDSFDMIGSLVPQGDEAISIAKAGLADLLTKAGDQAARDAAVDTAATYMDSLVTSFADRSGAGDWLTINMTQASAAGDAWSALQEKMSADALATANAIKEENQQLSDFLSAQRLSQFTAQLSMLEKDRKAWRDIFDALDPNVTKFRDMGGTLEYLKGVMAITGLGLGDIETILGQLGIPITDLEHNLDALAKAFGVTADEAKKKLDDLAVAAKQAALQTSEASRGVLVTPATAEALQSAYGAVSTNYGGKAPVTFEAFTALVNSLTQSSGSGNTAIGQALQQIYNQFRMPGFASGGITPGGPIMVGERGPEVLVPPAGSRILPNGSMGGSTVIVNQYGDVYGMDDFKRRAAEAYREMVMRGGFVGAAR